MLWGWWPRQKEARAGASQATWGHGPRWAAPRTWPSYDRCLEGAPIGTSGGPRRSSADFTWCLIAADWGHGVEDIAARLMEESSTAREYGEAYASLTAQRALNLNDYPRQPLSAHFVRPPGTAQETRGTTQRVSGCGPC